MLTIDRKKWYQSKTILSGIATLLANAYNLAIPVGEGFGISLPEIPQAALSFVTSLLGGIIIYGRKTAKQKI